ncbi:NUDIX domain-containing protein [Pseudomonas sp. KNUC1026]|uniref:NUDIX domain-containing protein n=1 Tax=Pseudomonas sp. KNUC1026 TaxID=2893890 RepID=UPI001F2524C3|nr:NUDIX domain-containing protein [Pseudomonas sp. KNUC1026]UFH50432.1 NUDIX domain-containing protein [Pseudomonas sp. KNUC1026]
MSDALILAGVDIVALRLAPTGLELLLIRRANAPFAGQWALPGVLVNGRCADPSLDAAAARALDEKARVTPQYLEQVATVGNGERDPRGWTMSSVYLALLAPEAQVEGEDLAFFPLSALPELPFDHDDLVQRARERLSSKAVYSSLPLLLLAPCFTVTEVLGAFEAVLGAAVQHTSLRKRLERMKQEGWVRETGDKRYPKMGRPQQVLERANSEVFLFDRSVLA